MDHSQNVLVLKILLKLKSKQGDVTAAFLCANVEKDEGMCVEMPLGFRKKGKVLKLKKTLYGLRQARSWPKGGLQNAHGRKINPSWS